MRLSIGFSPWAEGRVDVWREGNGLMMTMTNTSLLDNHFSLARHAADVGGGEISLRIGNKGCWRTGYGRLGSTVYGLPPFGEMKKERIGIRMGIWEIRRMDG